VSPRSADRRRVAIFGAIVAICAVVAIVAVLVGAGGDDGGTASASAAKVLPSAEADGKRMVIYRDLASHGRVQIAPAGATAAGPPISSGLRCDRVYFAAGRGLCVTRGGGFAAGYRAKVFDSALKVTADLPVQGIPSRARVSPDGRYGSTTLFVSGHAYAEAGTFSTATTLFDLRTGTEISDLEKFTTYAAGGKVVTAVDVNYWGVTFDPKNSDTFYATMATGGKTFLIRGSIAQRRAQVLKENVECPSLSPDGTRIAYKKRTGSKQDPWHLTVLDVKTLAETPLAEPRSVDDQVEWLDDQHVLYGVDSAIYMAAADGSGTPVKYVTGADSPAVVRWASSVEQ
jgi:hypothetical protein